MGAFGTMTAAALSLLHEFDATAMMLAWNPEVGMLIAGLGEAFAENLPVGAIPRRPDRDTFRSRERS
jgi:hypothetical protein